jgi:uncharacterized protein
VGEPTAARVVDRPDAFRYELLVDDRLAGWIEYSLHPPRIVMMHTEVDRAYEGRGLASRLAKGALDDARARDLKVVPRCPYIARYIDEHPQYRDLVDRGR